MPATIPSFDKVARIAASHSTAASYRDGGLRARQCRATVTRMSLLGNIVFFVFGGFVIFLGYVFGGILLCLTIIGIPFGFMCFRLASGVLAPFGREVQQTEPPGGAVAVIMNILWIILPGLELAIMHLLLALFFALTIIGFPIAVQHMKLVPLALLPFGHVMRDI